MKKSSLRDPNRLGHQAELEFQLKASREGFTVCKPTNDNAIYDFVVESSFGFNRVQVKSTHRLQGNSYRIHAVHGRHHRLRYSPRRIDFIAVYIAPEDTWYIIPIRAIRRRCLFFKPHCPHTLNLWEQYREAWHLLR